MIQYLLDNIRITLLLCIGLLLTCSSAIADPQAPATSAGDNAPATRPGSESGKDVQTIQEALTREANKPPPANNYLTPAEARKQARELEKLMEELRKKTEELSMRPRRIFVGARIANPNVAAYIAQVTDKVGLYCTNNIHSGAKAYGTALVQLEVDAEGYLFGFKLIRSSGSQWLDNNFSECVRGSAPFPAFGPELRKETDILVITRRISYVRGTEGNGADHAEQTEN